MPIIELTPEIDEAIKKCRDDYFKFLTSFKSMNDLVGQESELVIDKNFYSLLRYMIKDSSTQCVNPHLLGVSFRVIKSVYDYC